MAAKEWRIKSVRMRGTFRVFGNDKASAERQLTAINDRGDRIGLASDPNGPYLLQYREAGKQGDDSTWTTEAEA